MGAIAANCLSLFPDFTLVKPEIRHISRTRSYVIVTRIHHLCGPLRHFSLQEQSNFTTHVVKPYFGAIPHLIRAAFGALPTLFPHYPPPILAILRPIALPWQTHYAALVIKPRYYAIRYLIQRVYEARHPLCR